MLYAEINSRLTRLEARNETLVKSLRATRAVVGVTMAGLAIVLLVGQGGANKPSVHASDVAIYDSDSNRRIQLHVRKSGLAEIAVNQRDGYLFATVDRTGTPSLVLMGRDDKGSAVLRTQRKGAILIMRDAAENPCVIIETGDTGPELHLADSGQTATGLTTTTLSFRDEKGHVRLRLGVRKNGEPFIEALDDAEKVVWNAPR